MVRRGINRVIRRRRGVGRRMMPTNRRPKADFSAVALRTSPSPRLAQEAPWNSLVIQNTQAIPNSSVFTMDGLFIANSLRSQLGLPAATQLAIRLIAIKIFDFGARRLEARVFDPTITTSAALNDQLATALKLPSRAGYSSVGFVLPKAVSASTVNQATTTTVLTGNVGTPLGIVNVATTQVLFQIRVLWRVFQAGLPTGVTGPVTNLTVDLPGVGMDTDDNRTSNSISNDLSGLSLANRKRG